MCYFVVFQSANIPNWILLLLFVVNVPYESVYPYIFLKLPLTHLITNEQEQENCHVTYLIQRHVVLKANQEKCSTTQQNPVFTEQTFHPGHQLYINSPVSSVQTGTLCFIYCKEDVMTKKNINWNISRILHYFSYIEDITRWCEDIDFIFEWWKPPCNFLFIM